MKNFITSVIFFILVTLLVVALIQVAYKIGVLLYPYGLIVVAVCSLIYAIMMHRKRKAAKALYDKAYAELMKTYKAAQVDKEQGTVN
jgi:branched-subunit amino acid permease